MFNGIEEFLLSQSSIEEINARNQDGDTPLHIACQSGNIEFAEKLLRYNANPNIQNLSGHTPLHIASMCFDGEMVKLLTANGADVNISDHRGHQALHCWLKAASIAKELSKRNEASGVAQDEAATTRTTDTSVNLEMLGDNSAAPTVEEADL